MIQKLTHSEHVFEKDYTDSEKRNLKSKIVLHIDYTTSSYKITPGVGQNGQFGFTGNSCANSQLWMATAQLIQEAIEYAEGVVNPVKDISEIIEEVIPEPLEYKEHE